MAQSNSASKRFRSATEFPRTIQSVEPAAANLLYKEMRDCLIFTNRSRSQLARRNEEHKAKTSLLKQDVERLQIIIQQLAQDKQQISQENQGIIQALENEMATMSAHLDELSIAFSDIADVETAEQTQWSFIALPHRFFRFLKAVKAVVVWWQSERPEALPALSSQTAPDEEEIDEEADRRDRPQMYTDQASIGRSLLDR